MSKYRMSFRIFVRCCFTLLGMGGRSSCWAGTREQWK